ncbi:MAG TPA: ATP-binding protein, partial [Candidatus Dormibacteraeota bacterium]|nr:ATP-binding protein [Candidatus Dormibacteraeota bacterium]
VRQAERNVHSCHGGAGPGLDIARRLLDAIGGSIGLGSEVEAGRPSASSCPFAPIAPRPGAPASNASCRCRRATLPGVHAALSAARTLDTDSRSATV